MVFLDENKLDALCDDELRASEAATHACGDNLPMNGHLKAEQALQAVHVATTVHVRTRLVGARHSNWRAPMERKTVKRIALGNVVLVAVLTAVWPVQAQDAKAPDAKSPYPSMAPIAEYRMDRDAEIALARTAAPASISRDADVMVLGQKNYETAVHGKNGFVCLVGRAFTGPLTNPEFWNPKNRGPACLNPPAARSVLPLYLMEARMVLAGLSKSQIDDGINRAVNKKELGAPESGSMTYMLSKEAYLTDRGGHNLAHLMVELPNIAAAAWGADVADSPVFSASFAPVPMIEFNVPMGQWSDGTDATAGHTSASASHNH